MRTPPINPAPTAATYGLLQTFAPFDSGWRPFPHHYLLYAAAGAFHLELPRARWLLPPHRAAWIAAGTTIRIACSAPVTCCSVIFAPQQLPPPVADCRVFSVAPLAREMIAYAMRWGPQHAEPDPAAERFFLALADVCRELAAAPDQLWLPQARSPELRQALDFTLDNLADSALTLGAVAQAAAISERTLARRCAAELHMTWSQFVQRARILRAAELLAAAPVSVLEVADAVGLQSVSAFSAAFRAIIGEPPGQYRQRLQHPS